jgi:predicted nucleic acid-binding protein
MAVLIDTTGIWGLYFSNSKYHEFMKKLRSTTELIIPKIILVEVIYPVYNAEGISEMQNLGKFLEALKTAENITILDETLDDITSALEFCVLHKDLFVTEKGNLSLFDAILASIWKRTGLVFYTRDSSLEKFGKIYGLKYKNIEGNK